MFWKMNEYRRMDHVPFPVRKENDSGYSERNIYSYVNRRELKAREIKHFLLTGSDTMQGEVIALQGIVTVPSNSFHAPT